MNKYILLFLLLVAGFRGRSQCLVNSLIINTAYNPVTGLAIPFSADGATPASTDPKWIVTAESAGVGTAMAPTLPYLPLGSVLAEVLPGGSADIIHPAPGGWTTNPATNPGGWITCVNTSWYITDTITDYNMTLGRPFRMCIDDSITLDLYIANDDWISATNIDGTMPLLFTQPAGLTGSHYSTFTHFTQTVYLTAGTHTVNFVVHNYNFNPPVVGNATGLDVYGTFSSATGTSSLVKESDTTCSSYVCGSSPGVCNTLSLPDSIFSCIDGTTITLPGVLSGTDSVVYIGWSPSGGLSDSTILEPTLIATVAATGWYYLTVESILPPNLVANGDFSLGNVDFTSAYTYVSGAGSLVPAGVYAVTPDPHDDHPGAADFYDHTTGTISGSMMAINGASTPIDVWCETIAVIPNTYYDFSAWFANWSSDTTDNLPEIQFEINGSLIGSLFSFPHPDGIWTKYGTLWYSGTNTSITICINDQQTAGFGNDFAIDDISFQQVCVAKDSVFVDVSSYDTTYSSSNSTLCITAAPLTLTAPAGYTSYLWNTGAVTPSTLAFGTAAYWVYGIVGCTMFADTFNVHFIPIPFFSLGDDTAFCIGNSITLSTIQPVGTTYLWSNGSVGDSMHVSTSGIYWLQLNNGCTFTDSIHVTVSPFPLVNLGPDTSNCLGAAITLESSDTYTAPTYLWNDGSATPSITVPLSGTYWLQVTVGGCASADTINVTIYYDTFSLGNVDTAICRGAGVQTRFTANPSAIIQWLPTAGIAASATLTPWIAPDTSAMYSVNIYLPGCPVLKDSFYIDVQPTPIVYLGGDRSVCQFDTIHIHAYVTPAWYSHYIYSWNPPTYLDSSTMSEVIFTAGDSTELVLTVTTPAHIAGTPTCIGVDSASIVVHPGNFAGTDTTFAICPNDSVQLTPTGGVSYLWSPAMYLSDATAAAPWVHAITTQDYRAIATSQYGCLDTVNMKVIVYPAATILLPDSVTIYPGESFQLSPQSNCTSFAWYPPSGLSDAYISNPLATPGVSTKYIVRGTNEWGCVTTDSIGIYVDPNTLLAMPNAFTPGADVNGKLYIIKRGIATLSYFRIFNRWGNKVYESNNIEDGWDGTYNGTPQPLGVYVYEIEATTNTGAQFEKHGNVTLIR